MMVADTQVVVADSHTMVADARAMVTDTQVVVANTHMMVTDIHRSVLVGQDGTSGQNRSVGVARYPSTTECSPSTRLKPGEGY